MGLDNSVGNSFKACGVVFVGFSEEVVDLNEFLLKMNGFLQSLDQFL